MFWPGMGDPSKRKKTIKFLAISAAVGIAVVLISTTAISQIKSQDPLYHKCLNGLNIQYHVSASLEVLVDGKKWIRPISTMAIPANCQRSMVFTDDGTITGTWVNEYPFEVGQFLWLSGFPLRDMDEIKSKIYENDAESSQFIHAIVHDGSHYRAEFVTKNAGAPTFTPPSNYTK
ncbi:hypothetical protein [Candidatus Nitrosotalea bavarica]|uniref:hypothetical protein n=1 Tax=Candidatus Nitrosotalea bavarica TaxID=1903277 RepID=UPI000C7092AC|nr:hypothetical protein [Candidatus Nitrosotalea bavarica]